MSRTASDTIVVFLFLVAALGVILHLYGCGPEAVPLTYGITEKAAYERSLDACKDRGKDAGSYAVYAACADHVDRELCATKGLRCMDGGR